MDTKNIDQILRELHEHQSLIRAVFGNKRKKSLPYQKVVVRPISLKNQLTYQAEYIYPNKVVHENLHWDHWEALFQRLMEHDFKQVNLFCRDADYQILASDPKRPKILKQKPTKQPQSFSHDQQKKYIIPDGVPCDFLIHLGVMNDSGQVLKKYYAKFRQINRFLEIVRDVVDFLPRDRKITIIDFGCGKAYLTFALYYYLIRMQNLDAEIIGLDLKEDVIRFCNETASALQYDGLRFELGDIAFYETAAADMVVSLHACDTATDFALMKAFQCGASVILSVPCCQHELFDQISNELHEPLLKHGILKERFSSLLTDVIRTLKLEEWGYQVSVIEFTSLEHTSKNIMLRAVKAGPTNPDAAKKYKDLMEFWQVSPTIIRPYPE